MSSASVTSSKREKTIIDLKQEIEAIATVNSSLREFLKNLQTMRKDLNSINNSCKLLVKVNSQWIDTINLLE